MAFADPTIITIGGTPYSLVRINQDGYSSEYLLRSALDEKRLKIRNNSGFDKKRGVAFDNHNVELTQTIFPVAPATVSTVRKAYLVVQNQVGDTLTDPVAMVLGMLTLLTASSGANITKMLNSES